MTGSVNLVYFYKSDISAVQGHWFWHNRKHVCDFLLVRHNNRGPILHHFGDTAAFMCPWPHPYSTLILGVFPFSRSEDRPCWGQCEQVP